MKHNSKRTIAGLMAILMVLAVILSIPVMTMNDQPINDPGTNNPAFEGLSATLRDTIGYKYGLIFDLSFHEKGEHPFDANAGTIWYPEDDETYQRYLNENMHGQLNIEDIEKIDFDAFMESDDWANIETMCYQYMDTMYRDYGWKGRDCVLDIEMRPIDYDYDIYKHGSQRPTEYKYGFLDGIHTVTLELPDDYINPNEIPEPTSTPIIDQLKPVDNAATLAPKIQVDNKPMSVQHSTLTVTINGVPTELDAIVLTESNGGAHTYYKLRDVGEKVGFDVNWTPETGITVDTRK